MGKFEAILIIVLLSISAISLTDCARCQPVTWEFEVNFLPAEFYMGEWGTLQINITNYDCLDKYRKNIDLHFDKILLEDFEAVKGRAEDMKEKGLIWGYYPEIKRSWGFGGTIYHEAELHLSGVCGGRAIKIIWVRFWFDWSRGGGREAAGFKVDVNSVLEAFDPVQYILNGFSPGSSMIISAKVFIPEWIEPEERFKRPHVDIRVDYPKWIPYTFEDFPVGGPFEIKPYRSFNLTITDFDGVHRLGGAKVVIRQLIHYYRVWKFITPENGTIRIWRLPEARHDVRVYWNSSYRQEKNLIYIEMPTAYDLASSGIIRTSLFNLRINPLDRRGRPLIGAKVVFDGFERIAENGTATYDLVPQGNHTAQIYWKGVKVFDGWLWAGYHPTIYPWMTRPARIHDLKLPVDDLIIQAVDTGGGCVGANYTVTGPNPELSFKDIYSRNGTLIISQLPMARYHVRAINCSNLFGRCVEAAGDYEPGNRSTLTLPIHSIRLRILSSSSKPLKDAYVRLGPAHLRTDDDGLAWFVGVPEGRYEVEVMWRNLTVYEGWMDVAGSVEKDVKTKVYDISLRFETSSGKSYPCLLNFTAPAGINVTIDSPVKSFRAKYVPEGLCDLTIYTLEGVRLRELRMNCSEMAGMEVVKLPISDMRLRVAWSDGEPIKGCKIEVDDRIHGKRFEGLTDENGTITLKDMIFSNYTIKINYPYTPILMKMLNETFKGDEVAVRVESCWLRVRVVDLLGRPLRGAEVGVLYGSFPIKKSITGADGTAYFRRILKLPTYTIHVKYGSSEKRVYARPDESVEARMNVIEFGDVRNLLNYVVIVGVIAAVLIISIKLVLYVKSTLR